MKFNFLSFIFAISTGVHATSLRGSGNNNHRALSSTAQVLDLEEFIQKRVSGVVGGNRLLPPDSTFDSLDTDSLIVRLRDDTMELGPFLNPRESDPTSISQVSVINNSPEWSERPTFIGLNGSVEHEVSASVTSGFTFNNKEYTASVGVAVYSEFEFTLTSTVPTTESVEKYFPLAIAVDVPPNTKMQATRFVKYIVTDPTSFSVDIDIFGVEDDISICYYYRDSQNIRNYMCSTIVEIFLQQGGQPDHSFTFRLESGLDDAIRYQAEGQLTGVGVGGHYTWVELDLECLPTFVWNSDDGLCVPESEVEDSAGAHIVPEGPYHKERLVFDENGGVQTLLLDNDGDVVQMSHLGKDGIVRSRGWHQN